MTRGLHNQLGLDERLEKINSEIEAAEAHLKTLQNQKAELEKQIKMARKEFISSRGLSTEEAKKL